MGSGCYRGEKRELLFVGGYCENSCFQSFGGCDASVMESVKSHETCELKPEAKFKDVMPIAEVNKAVAIETAKGNEIFLYTPDMFSDFYYHECFEGLSIRNGQTHICVNACAPARSFCFLDAAHPSSNR